MTATARHLTESWCRFGPVTTGYDGDVLEPRPWTILQSTLAAARLRDGPNGPDGPDSPDGPIVELHCGAGHVGQAAALLARRAVVQVDDSAAACRWASRNARRNHVPATIVRAAVEHLPLRGGIAALVLADPPYVPSADVDHHPNDPRHAIDGGRDGLDGLRACLAPAVRLLTPGGSLVLPLRGAGQVAPAVELAELHAPELRLDDVVLRGADRAVAAFVRR